MKYLIWKISWNLIFNQSNIEGWNWKNNFNDIKRLLKIAITIMRIKIEKQNKLYIWLMMKLKRKTNLIKKLNEKK